MKKYHEYKESEIEWLREIPVHWEVIKLRYLSDVTTGDKDTENREENGQFPFFVRSQTVEKISSCSFDGEAILTAGDGVGVCKVWHYIDGKFDYHQRVYMMSNFKMINGQYLFQFLRENFVYEVLKLSAKSTVDSLRRPMFLNFPVAVPPLLEQTQIAKYLDHQTSLIDAIIKKKELLIKKLKEQRQAIINEAVTKGLNPNAKMKDSGIEWLGEIPEGWEVSQFRYCFQLNKGLTITKENLVEEGIPCVNYGEIHSKFGFEVNPSKDKLGCVSEDYLESNGKSLLSYGDFVFADTSEDIEGSGNFTYLNSDLPTFAGYHTIIARLTKSTEYRYFAYILDSKVFRAQIRNKVKGVKVYSITNKILKEAVLFFPSEMEQKEVSDFLDVKTNGIYESIERLKSSIDKLKAYRQSIISEAVTGKIDVREWQPSKD